MQKHLYILLYMTISSLFLPYMYAQEKPQKTYDDWVTESFDWLEADSLHLAEIALQEAMRLEPANSRNAMLFTNLGTIQRKLGKWQDAEISYTCALALLPNQTDIIRNRASLYAEMEDYDKAISDYTDIIIQNATDEDAYYQRALCRLMNKDTIGARMDLELIDKFNPKSAKARLGMAYVYKTCGEYGLAAELYDVLLEANPQNAMLLRERAEVYYLSGRMGAALQDINQSISLQPKDPISYLIRANIRLAKGDKEYARRDLNLAQEMGLPKNISFDLEKKLP